MTAESKQIAADILTSKELDALDLSDLAPARSLENIDDVLEEHGFWESFDGQTLFWRSWTPEGGPTRGVVALMHGFGEHSARYDHVAAALCRAGYTVMAIDARGHGRSGGKRAHINAYQDYIRDYDLLVMHARAEWPELALFCLGHSNGGFILLRYALTHPDGVTGFILTSPMCALAVKVNPLKALAGKLMSALWPSFTMANGLDAAAVSHLDEVVQNYQRDPLGLDIVSARWFTEVLDAQRDLKERAATLDQPFLFLLSGADQIVDPSAAEAIFHQMESEERELEIYPKLYHEILNEEPWAEITRRILGWMEARRAAGEERPAEESPR